MNPNKLPDYLGHMQSAAEDAGGFIVGMSKSAFFDDRRSQNAVVTRVREHVTALSTTGSGALRLTRVKGHDAHN